MQSVEEFKRKSIQIFVDEIIEELKPFEEERKRVIKECYKYIFLFVIGLILNIPLFFFLRSINSVHSDFKEVMTSVILWIDAFILLYFAYNPFVLSKTFERNIKRNILPRVLKNLDHFKWCEKSTISTGDIRRFGLFQCICNRDDDDNFCGFYKDIKIEICETVLYHSKDTIFKGVIIRLTPQKAFKGFTLIKQKGIHDLERNIYNFLGLGQGIKFEKVNLEDVEFNKKYNVVSTNQIEARYLLTTSFMERFQNIAFAFKSDKTEASFNDEGNILIAVFTNNDLFKLGSLNKPVFNFNQYKTMIEEFASILELIDELKLNQDIGL